MDHELALKESVQLYYHQRSREGIASMGVTTIKAMEAVASVRSERPISTCLVTPTNQRRDRVGLPALKAKALWCEGQDC
jgi:hypothetical protein